MKRSARSSHGFIVMYRVVRQRLARVSTCGGCETVLQFGESSACWGSSPSAAEVTLCAAVRVSAQRPNEAGATHHTP